MNESELDATDIDTEPEALTSASRAIFSGGA